MLANTCDVGLSTAALAGIQALAKIDIRGHGCPDDQYVCVAVDHTMQEGADRTQGTQHGSISKLRENCWKDSGCQGPEEGPRAGA